MDTNTPSSTRKEIIKRKTLQASTEAATLETAPDASGVTCKQHHNNDNNNNSNRKIINKGRQKQRSPRTLLFSLSCKPRRKKQGDFEWIPRSRPSRRRCSAWPAHQEHYQISTACDVKSNNTTATTKQQQKQQQGQQQH